MNDEEKKLSEQAKRLEKIRRVLCDNSNNKLAAMLGTTPHIVSNLVRRATESAFFALDLRKFCIFAALISSHICKF